MKKFKDYAQEENNANASPKNASSAEELTKKIAAAYNGKSNVWMMKSILAEAERSKREGTLSNEEIDAFYASFAPMLDEGQRKRLYAVVKKLKEI